MYGCYVFFHIHGYSKTSWSWDRDEPLSYSTIAVLTSIEPFSCSYHEPLVSLIVSKEKLNLEDLSFKLKTQIRLEHKKIFDLTRPIVIQTKVMYLVKATNIICEQLLNEPIRLNNLKFKDELKKRFTVLNYSYRYDAIEKEYRNEI